MILNWKISKEDHDLIVKIAERAEVIARRVGKIAKGQSALPNRRDVLMDVTAVHANGNPLRLAELLKADDSNFIHDVFGIHAYLDRETGKLTECFVPRFTGPSEGTVTAHHHRPKRRREHQEIHGKIVWTDSCRCGATRESEISAAGQINHGPWKGAE